MNYTVTRKDAIGERTLSTHPNRTDALLAMNKSAWGEFRMKRHRHYKMNLATGTCVVANWDGSLVAKYTVSEVTA